MANFDRAKNERGRDEDVFDGGEDGDDHENEGSHLPVVIIIAILVLAAFGGVVWLAYNQGVARGRNDAPVRVAAAQASKADDPGLKVYQQSAGPEDADAKPAQAAPQPATPPPVQAQAQTPAPAQAQTPPPVQPAPVQPAPKLVAPVAPPPVVTPPAPKPQPTAAAKPAPAKAAAQDLAPPQPQVATKPPTPLAHPAVQAPVTPAAMPPKPVAVKPATEAPVKATAAGGGYLLQIGAYKSEEEARAAWKTYQSKHATLLNGFGPDVQRTTHDDGSVWYRLRIASFADKDAATAVCERLKAQGGTCFLAK